MDLGRLEKVELRKIWSTEAADFTPWLARPENLAVLADTIGIELELEAQERSVGPFRADILCKSADDGRWVLVENQLERTDHTHLGQLLTYAAGLQAVTIVWIAARFTEEHRAALDWLNEITDESFEFFGLEVELWRIGTSPAAPKFNTVSKPNDWSRGVGQAAKRIESEALTDTRQKQLAYWTMFKDRLIASNSPVRPQKPYLQHWMNFSIGRSGFALSGTLIGYDRKVGVELYIGTPTAKVDFKSLANDRIAIERDTGMTFAWMELPDRKACRIVAYREGLDPLNEADWPVIAERMQSGLERLREVFGPRVRALNAAEHSSPAQPEPLS